MKSFKPNDPIPSLELEDKQVSDETDKASIPKENVDPNTNEQVDVQDINLALENEASDSPLPDIKKSIHISSNK